MNNKNDGERKKRRYNVLVFRGLSSGKDLRIDGNDYRVMDQIVPSLRKTIEKDRKNTAPQPWTLRRRWLKLEKKIKNAGFANFSYQKI